MQTVGVTGPRTWLITGAGRGFGRAFTDAALAAGDRVIATARRPEQLRNQLAPHGARAAVYQLDVNKQSDVISTIESVINEVGGLDIVVNNAGYGLSGAVEEVTELDAREQFETNFFGALWVTQAVLPHMRARRRGHIIQVSSLAGVISAPNLGIYCASKWALEAMSEALAGEVKPFGIHVTIVEPSGFRTEWDGSSMVRAQPLAAYDEVLAGARAALSVTDRRVQPGDPARAAQVLLQLVDAAEPPLRLPLGNMAVDVAARTYQARMEASAAWADVSRSADAAVATS
jgi:NAD(P)-dependent dehydrogenase (short-subunit alcohol dehydrogenase family)